MKKFYWLPLTLIVSMEMSAQVVTQKGVAYRYNGEQERTPLGNVTIRYDADKRTTVSSEQDGTFSLTLNDRRMGDRIGLVTVKKREMMVFNQQAVDEWSVRKDPLILILCDAEEFERQKENLINIGKREAKKKYDLQKAALKAKLDASEIQLAEYEAALDKAYDELDRLNQHVGEYADLFARIDKSEIDTLAQRAMDLYHEGRVNEAIRLFEQGNYLATLDRALKTGRQADELKAVAAKAKERAGEDSLKAIQSLNAQIEAYKLNNEWDKAGELLKGLADRLNTAGVLFDYAVFCQGQNNFEDAEVYYQKALEIYLLLAQSDSRAYELDVAKTRNKLAVLYKTALRFADAEKMFLTALEISGRLAQSNPRACEPFWADIQNNLANLYSDTRRFADAERMYLSAMEIYERLAQSNPQAYEPGVAETRNNLAVLYKTTRRLSDAERMYLSAMEISERLAQSDPQAREPDLADIQNNLANLYSDTRRLSDAEKMYLSALEIYERLAQSNPQAYEPDVADIQSNLAVQYKNTRRFADAEKMYLSALEIYERFAQSYRQAYEPDVARTRNSLANLYSDTRRFADAGKMYLSALEIRQRLAQSNPQAYEVDVAETQYCTGLLKVHQEQYADAIPSFEEALAVFRRLAKLNPEQQQMYEFSLRYLSQHYPEAGNYGAAYRINKEWLPILKSQYEESPAALCGDYADGLGRQSFCAIFMKQYAEAELLAREGLSADSTKHRLSGHLAAALLFQGKYAKAEKIYRQYKEELKEGVLDDFRRFAEAGVIPKEREADAERIRRLLNDADFVENQRNGQH